MKQPIPQNNNFSQISPQRTPPSPTSPEQVSISQCTRGTVRNHASRDLSLRDQEDRYRKKARIIAWADLIYAAFNIILFVFAIGSIMRLYMDSRIGVAPSKVEGTMVITIFCVIFLSLNIWFDFGLLKATNQECGRVMAIEHAIYWRVISISLLFVTLILIYNAAVYIFPGCIAVLCFSIISFFVRLVFILIVQKYIKVMVRLTGGFATVGPELEHLFVTDRSQMIHVDLRSTVVLEQK